MRRVLTYTLAGFMLAPSLQAAHRPKQPNPDSSPVKARAAHRHKPAAPYQVGKASWYGKRFQGRETASGERYDMYDLTAAHRRLPLGTLVRVTNLRNGQSVVVRINDRGPVFRTRIIDLSYEAARALHMKAEGVQWVRLDILPAETMAAAGEVTAGLP
jgi:rare lipoprotein A